MTAHRRHSGARLSASAQQRFDRLVRVASSETAAKHLGIGQATLDKLSGGLGVRADVIAKVEASLAREEPHHGSHHQNRKATS